MSESGGNEELIDFSAQIGIVILIVGSFWPSLYYGMLPFDTHWPLFNEPIALLLGFRDDPVFQVGYIALITSLGICKSCHGMGDMPHAC